MAVEENNVMPTIPPYALDMHTSKGRAAGKGMIHFMEEATMLSPELPERDQTYKSRIMEALKASK